MVSAYVTYLQRAFLVLAVLMTAMLLGASMVPSTGQIFKAESHWLAHFASFVLLAFAWRCGLPRVAAATITIAVVVFAFAHEAIEVIGHGHAYELADALVDALGAAIGVLMTRLIAQPLRLR